MTEISIRAASRHGEASNAAGMVEELLTKASGRFAKFSKKKIQMPKHHLYYMMSRLSMAKRHEPVSTWTTQDYQITAR